MTLTGWSSRSGPRQAAVLDLSTVRLLDGPEVAAVTSRLVAPVPAAPPAARRCGAVCAAVAPGTAARVYILGLIASGLVVGALGRLAIPGPNPMSLGRTILVGIGGSFLGGLVGYALFRGRSGLILSVLGAALIVWLLERRKAPRLGGSGQRWPSQ